MEVESELSHQTNEPVFSNRAGNSLPAKEVVSSLLFKGKCTNEGDHHLKDLP